MCSSWQEPKHQWSYRRAHRMSHIVYIFTETIFLKIQHVFSQELLFILDKLISIHSQCMVENNNVEVGVVDDNNWQPTNAHSLDINDSILRLQSVLAAPWLPELFVLVQENDCDSIKKHHGAFQKHPAALLPQFRADWAGQKTDTQRA